MHPIRWPAPLRLRVHREEGVVLPLVALTLLAMVLVAALSTEVGAAILEREHLQTAVDAAALAGTLNAEPWMSVQVQRSRLNCKWDTDSTGQPVQSCFWSYDAVALTGRQNDLVRNWAAEAGCGAAGWRCAARPQVLHRWVIFPPGTAEVVRQTFWANVPSRPDVTVSSPDIRIAAGNATVTVSATGSLRTRLLRLIGIASLPLSRRSVALAQLQSPPWP